MLWRKIGGAKPKSTNVAPSHAEESSEAAAAPVEGAGPSQPPLPIPVPPPPPPPGYKAPARAPAAAEEVSLVALFAEDEDVYAPSSTSITLDVIVNRLIVEMKQEWKQFFTEIDECVITFPQLSKTFGLLHRRQVHSEVEILCLSREKGHKADRDRDWIRQHVELILDYKLLDEHRKRLSLLLDLLKLLAPLFSEDLSRDELYQSLQECHERLEAEWEHQTLANTTVSICPHRAGLNQLDS